MPQDVERELQADTFRRSFMARLEVAQLSGEKLVEEYRDKIASAMISAGITLIPSDHLRDHEYVVSRGVYEAAKKLSGIR